MEKPTQQIDKSKKSDRRSDSVRPKLNAPVSVVIESKDRQRVGVGTANLRDLSLNGALLTDINLSGDSQEALDPEVEYLVKFRLMTGPLSGMEAQCRAVRYDRETNGFGLRMPDGFRLPIA